MDGGFLLAETPDILEARGWKVRITCSYDRVLNAQRLFKDSEIDRFTKIDLSLKLLTEISDSQLKQLTPPYKEMILEAVSKSQIELQKKITVGKQIKSFDFFLDGEYIYASFMQAYGIDLLDRRGKLHWKRFIALFQGLPDSTKIKEIMKIRSMDVPEPTKWNQKERQNILELKTYYQLPVEGGGGQQGLDLLFSTLERQA